MAKKSQAVQLQQEIFNDDEWEKMYQKDGLIVIDIYSEWCGPCVAMTANLKKLKLEIGGDNLHLAMAKSDNISSLERFRSKSEPTWMFIAGGKMVNLMFGANAPKLVRLIIEELKNEAGVLEGNRERFGIDISELSEEEQIRFEATKKINDEIRAIETEKKESVIRTKRLAAANVVLEHIQQAGVVLVFPHAAKQAQSLLTEHAGPLNLVLSVTEKPQFTEAIIEELLYFANSEFNKGDAYNLLNAQSFILLFKATNMDDLHNGGIDTQILNLVYGNSKCPPGSPESPAQLLMEHITEKEMRAKLATNSKSLFQSKAYVKIPVEEENQKDEEEEVIVDFSGLWAPPNALTKATAIKLFFPKLYDPIAIPEPPPIPPHVAVAYEIFKTKDVLDLVNEHRGHVIRYGFFSEDNPESARLIAKTLPAFEKIYATGTTYTERLVVQVAKVESEPLNTFLELGPTFVSINSVEGERDCKSFFADNYDVPDHEHGTVEVKKKKKKGRKPKEAVVPSHQELAEGEQEVLDEIGALEDEAEEQGDGESEGEAEGDANINGGNEEVANDGSQTPLTSVEGADKATSPMPDEGSES